MNKFSFKENIKKKNLKHSLKYEIMDKIYEKNFKKKYLRKFAYGLGSLLIIFFTLFIGYKVGQKTNENKTTLVFKLKKPNAGNVKLVGDFNNWNKNQGIELKKQNGYWKTKIKLEEGSYRYFFIVDGKVVLDPSNPTINDPFGDKLSLVNVSQARKGKRL